MLSGGSLQALYVQYQAIIRPVLRIGPVFGGIAVLAWRVRETRVPITLRTIVIPPFAMSTGFCMFLAPTMRVPWTWAATTFLTGLVILSWPLVRSSRLEMRDGVVYLRRSPAFLAILLGLLVIRLALHDYVGHLISPLQTAALFYLLAFGMIARWRFMMFREYQRLMDAR